MAAANPAGTPSSTAGLSGFGTYAGAKLANFGLVQGDIDSIVTAQGTSCSPETRFRLKLTRLRGQLESGPRKTERK